MTFAELLLLVSATSVDASSMCPSQDAIPFDASIAEVHDTLSHGAIYEVVVMIPLRFRGLEFKSVELTYGKVEEFRIPLDNQEHQEEARASFLISSRYVDGLELSFHFAFEDCEFSSQQQLWP